VSSVHNHGVNNASLFCGTALAQRIEEAEAQLIVAATEAAGRRGAKGMVLPVAGGFACFADDGSPMNKVVGVGFNGVPDSAELDQIERTLSDCGVPVQVELSNLADPEVAAVLSDRGYRLIGFENVLGRSLLIEPEAPLDIDVRKRTDDEFDAWVAIFTEGFANPDGEGVPGIDDFPRDVVANAMRDIEKAGATNYVALCDEVIAGVGSVRLTDGIAQLTGAATAPAFRRRGAQSALLTARLRDAAAAECDIAVVTTAPGSRSQKNVQNKGFQLLYTRAVMVKASEAP
jgi:ribosomal protein S18 acetylase RimI-like enzyme